MLREDKERIVAELVERLRQTETLMVADYRGLTMKEIDELRTRLLEHGARFTVVKNTLTRRAAEAAGSDTVLSLIEGPTAIAFLDADGDPVAVAKALQDTARQTRVLAVRGGVLDGKPISENDVRNLASLPPLQALHGQVLGSIVGPLMMVVGLFSATLSDLVGLIDGRVEQLGGEQAAPEAEAAPEPEAEAAPEVEGGAAVEAEPPEAEVPVEETQSEAAEEAAEEENAEEA
jgi:large subunit ribosomal protein L10